MITYGLAYSDQDLQAILDLQAQNLPIAISEEEATAQGFLTLQHDFDLLKKMNSPYSHTIAQAGQRLAGYALTMEEKWKVQLPTSIPFIQEINQSAYRGKSLAKTPYIIMGQVCVAKDYRGKGVFRGLYEAMAKQMQSDFEYILTAISINNKRSLAAHYNVGFEDINPPGKDWALVALHLP